MKHLVILGSSGSIGQSTLAVVRANAQLWRVWALTADRNVDSMLRDCLEFAPAFAVMANAQAAHELAARLASHGCATKVLAGGEGLIEVASHPAVDCVMAAIVGAAGLLPTMAAVRAGKQIFLANKEALVMSGEFFMAAVRQHGAQLLPIDSEHNAIFQCLPHDIQGQLGYCDLKQAGISKILLTGSGGPFRYTPIEALREVTPAQAIAHPNWSMGAKISVDSATMMNKGLEYIEARWLFNAEPSQIQVVIHPQSIIHSMVQYNDGSVLAQLGQPDMRTPIAHALAYPQRISSGVEPLDFFSVSELSFLRPDMARYPCLALAIEACEQGQAATTALNAANEVAVAAFLAGQIGFMSIAKINASVMHDFANYPIASLEDLLALDQRARIKAMEQINRGMQ